MTERKRSLKSPDGIVEFRRFRSAIGRGNIDNAIDWLQRGIRRSAAEGDKWAEGFLISQYATILTAEPTRTQEVIDILEKAFDRGLTAPSLKLCYARTLLNELREVDKAVRELQTLLLQRSTTRYSRHNAYTLLGHAYLMKGQFPEALQCMQLSLRVRAKAEFIFIKPDISLAAAFVREGLYPVETLGFFQRVATMCSGQDPTFDEMISTWITRLTKDKPGQGKTHP